MGESGCMLPFVSLNIQKPASCNMYEFTQHKLSNDLSPITRLLWGWYERTVRRYEAGVVGLPVEFLCLIRHEAGANMGIGVALMWTLLDAKRVFIHGLFFLVFLFQRS